MTSTLRQFWLGLFAAWFAMPMAAAQSAAIPINTWVYINASGIKTFSDVAPPAGTPEKNILTRPSGAPTATPVQAAASAPAGGASAPVPRLAASGAGKETELQKRIKAEADAKKAAEDAAEAAEKAKEDARRKEACAATNRQLTSLKAGNRMATSNDKGERVVMDDKMRADAIAKSESALKECN